MRSGGILCVWLLGVIVAAGQELGTISNPAKSCNDVLRNVPNYSDGIYHVLADAVSVVPVYCNFGIFPGRGATLLYKLSVNVSGDTYALWSNFEPLHENTSSLLTLNKSSSHYVSRLISYWGNVKKASVRIYTGGKQMKFIDFNTIGTTPTSFFLPPHVVNSSWPDLLTLPPDWGQNTGDPEVGKDFSIKAFNKGRSWYISKEWVSCGQDVQWMLVSYQHDTCDSVNFNTSRSQKIQIVYSNAPNASDNYAYADVFTVWADLEDIDNSKGFKPSTAVTSCNDLLDIGNQGRGVYYLQYNSSDIVPVYCDFSIFPGSVAHMIFKINSNKTAALPELYWNGTAVNDTLPAIGTFTTGLSLNQYVSRIQPHMAQFTRMTTRLYTNSTENAFINFRVPVGSNITNWFSPDNQYNSSWIDLPNSSAWFTEPDPAYDVQHIFSIHPLNYSKNAYNRTFYINRLWGGCPNDTAWLQIQPINPEYCDKYYWPTGRPHNESTTILYSTLTTQGRVTNSSQFTLAQTFVVWAEVQPVPCNCSSNIAGKCAFMGECICNFGFVGINCSQCAPNFYGPYCEVYCDHNTTCSGKGFCSASGSCSCLLGYVGPSCATCAEFFAGPNCSSCSDPGATYPFCEDKGQCGDHFCSYTNGENCANCLKDCPGPCGVCGDGYCNSTNENCSSCYVDCGPCANDLTCPNNCNNNGLCNKGVCVCSESWSGPNCDTKTAPINVNLANSSISISNIQNTYQVSFQEIDEISENGAIVQSFSLQNYTPNFMQTTTSNYTLWNASISFGSIRTVDISIFLYPTATNVTFANKTVTIQPNTLKINTEIKWAFLSARNALAIKLRSISGGPCDTISGYQQGDALQWVQVGNLTSSLFIQFLQYALIDGIAKPITFSYKGNGDVLMNIPHFWDTVVVDPNYQVLVGGDTPNSKQNINDERGGSACSPAIRKSHGLSKGVIAAICVPIIGVAILIIIAAEIFRYRKRQRLRHAFELQSVSK